jgi:dimethylglycine catabolism B
LQLKILKEKTDMGQISRESMPPSLSWIAENIISKDNIIGAARESKSDWAKNLNLSSEGETLFFAGCGYQYASGLESLMNLAIKADKSIVGYDRLVGVADFMKKFSIDPTAIYRKMTAIDRESDGRPLRDAVNVLKKLGVEFGYLGDEEPCCGGPLYFFGLRKEFADRSMQLYNKLKKMKVRRIIGVVPSCTHTLRRLVADCVEGFDLEVKHWSEVVLERMGTSEYRFPEEVSVVYHDPCILSRYMDIVEQPREILKKIKGIKIVEPEWGNKKWSTCCGGGGGFEASFPELSKILSVNRVNELVKTGAQIIVTSCPGCLMQLKNGLTELKNERVQILDLTEVVARAMEVK